MFRKRLTPFFSIKLLCKQSSFVLISFRNIYLDFKIKIVVWRKLPLIYQFLTLNTIEQLVPKIKPGNGMEGYETAAIKRLKKINSLLLTRVNKIYRRYGDYHHPVLVEFKSLLKIHRGYQAYLYRFGHDDSPYYPKFPNIAEDAEYAFFHCPKFAVQMGALEATTGDHFTQPSWEIERRRRWF